MECNEYIRFKQVESDVQQNFTIKTTNMNPVNTLWTAQVFAKLSRINKQILETKAELLNATDEIRSKLDEKILRDLRTAFRHLRDGALSSVSDVQQNEFQTARQKFAELVELDPNDTTKGTSGEFSNRYLIALGYLGNFHYYNLFGDKRMAAVQVYECLNKFLEWNDCLKVVETFSIEALDGFFSKNYLKEIGGAEVSLDLAQQGFKETEKGVFQKKLRTLGILSAGTITTVVAGEALLLSLPLLAGAGVAGYLFGDKLPSGFKEKTSGVAKNTFASLKNMLKNPNTQEEKDSCVQLEKLIEDLKSEFEGECRERLTYLQSTDSSELMILDFDTSTFPIVNQIQDLLEKNSTILPTSSKVALEEEKNSLTKAIEQVDTNLVSKSLMGFIALLNPANLTELAEDYSELVESCSELLENCDQMVTQLQEIGVFA